MNFDYTSIFERNYGIFSPEEQERIRTTRVLLAGDSGSGETIAIILARSGFEQFIICGQETYQASDMNRQIGCFEETIGKSKIKQIAESILAINPAVHIETFDHFVQEDKIDDLVSRSDIIIPAVEDLSYSILIFRSARKLGKPAILCMPSGSMAWVSTFDKNTPSIEDVFGIPKLSYKGLRTVMHTREYRCAQYNFITSGDWRVSWFWNYFLDKRPLALICPVEWLAASLAALEALKIASKKWQPIEAPKCWYIRKGKVSRSHFSLFIQYHRKLGWAIFGNGIGQKLHKITHLFWRNVFRFLRFRQNHKN
ncbi:MAG: ThiF family adenylyltransferase [Deltaproteobacteria bacterium]|nr:ThiF family adenylyltransferase [Deltaproteobacteria bacterium]